MVDHSGCEQEEGRPVSGWRWRKVKGVDRSALREARLQAHYGVQWLARAARAYATPGPGDRHTNLGWDDGIAGLTTRSLAPGTMLGLNISDLTLILWDAPGSHTSG